MPKKPQSVIDQHCPCPETTAEYPLQGTMLRVTDRSQRLRLSPQERGDILDSVRVILARHLDKQKARQ